MNEELLVILLKSNSYLEDAIYLYDAGRYESTVNRAYYAMFATLQGLLLNENVFVKSHAGPKTKFHELLLKTKRLPVELGKIFEDALVIRQDADYDHKFEVSQEDVLKQLMMQKYF